MKRLDNTWLADVDALERHLESFRVRSNFECSWSINQTVVDELLETHGEVLHTFGCTDTDGIGKLLVFFFQEQFSDHGGEGHDFASRNAGYALLDRSQKFLRDDAFHIEGDGVSDRFVKFFWEQVQDTTDGRWCG